MAVDTKQVIAYHAHEYEAESVAKNVSDVLAKTDSYVIGSATDQGIDEMRSQGVIVEPYRTPDIAPDFRVAGLADFTLSQVGAGPTAGFAPRAADLRTVVFEREAPTEAAHYLITLLTPLTEGVRTTIEAAGVTLLTLVPPQSFVAYLTGFQVDTVRSMPEVAGIRRYGAEDTAPALAATKQTAEIVPGDVERYDVHPDRREDFITLLNWLSDHQIQYERRGRSLRLSVPTGSDVTTQIEALQVAVTVLPVEAIFDLRLHSALALSDVVKWLEERRVTVIGANRRKIRIRLDNDDGSLYDAIRAHDAVQAIDPFTPSFLDNDAARLLLGIDRRNSATVVQNIALTGTGEIVGIADSGVDATHPDLKNRLLKVIPRGRPGNGNDPHGHGTHVAGSIAGDGTASGGSIRGVAPGAQLVVQSLLDSRGTLGGLPIDLNDLFAEAYAEGVRIHNNSWGSFASGDYVANSEEIDEFVHEHPDMLVVIAAGNEGTAAAPDNASPGFVDLFSLRAQATAKNALTIGASRSNRTDGGYATRQYGTVWPADFPQPPISLQNVSGDPQSLAAFSSRGPSTDRRVKPDLVAPGTDIRSTRSAIASRTHFWAIDANPSYAYMGGTSMAAPLVAGCAALVREYYRTKRAHEPSAALLKATLINGGRWLTGSDAVANHPKMPNYHQGFGLLSIMDAIPQEPTPAFQLDFRDGWKDPVARFDASGQQRQFRFTTTSPGPIRICLTWTDPPARGIQNVLQVMLEALDGPLPHRKWLGNEDRPTLLNTRDEENNVQVIRVENAPVGGYMVQVSNRALLTKPQTFALVISRPD